MTDTHLRELNPWYFQCLPGQASSTSKVSSTSSTSSSPPTSTTKQEPPPSTTLSTSTVISSSSSTSSDSPPNTSTGSPAPSPSGSLTRVRFHPESIASRKLADSDFADWIIPEGGAQSTTINDIAMTVTPASGANLDGAYYKFGFTNPTTHLGERVTQQGITTDPTNNAITLTLKGLPAGSHTLLTYHNSWNAGTNLAKVSITVNGQTAASVSLSSQLLQVQNHVINIF